MLVRCNDGKLVEIIKNNFINDKEYYNELIRLKLNKINIFKK